MARKKEMAKQDQVFFATTMTSMLSILRTRFSCTEIKKMLTRKNIDEVLKLLEEIQNER